jgi:hypothetical protein
MRKSLIASLFFIVFAAFGEDDLSLLREILESFDSTSLKTMSAMPEYQREAKRLSRKISLNNSRIRALKRSLPAKRKAIKSAKAAPPLRGLRKTSERIGYYYIDDPNRTFVPISIPRDRHRNVRWIYPEGSGKNERERRAIEEYDDTLREISSLISENDSLRREYRELRRECRAALKAKIARLESSSTESESDAADGESASLEPSGEESSSFDAAGESLKLKSEKTIRESLKGETESEVLAKLGKPDKKESASFSSGTQIDSWSYRKFTKDELTGKWKDMLIIFNNNRVGFISFTESFESLLHSGNDEQGRTR